MGASLMHLMARFDASPTLWYLVGAAGLWLLISACTWLADRIDQWWHVRRHRYDGLQDPRVLRPVAKRHLELIKR